MKWVLFSCTLLLVLGARETPAQPRGGTDEWSLNLLVIGSNRYDFEGGASLRNDGGAGIGLSLTRNLNNYFAIGLEGTLAEFDYRASVAPGPGNAGTGFETDGDMESATLRLQATWNLLARRLTPFITAGAGVTFLDANFATAAAPANACWIYPWYGQVCSDKPPGTTLTRFSYGAGAGLRLDFPRKQGFIRAYFGGEWIESSEALGSVGYFQMRADFGVPF
jgi:hypothetical protein